MYILETPMDYKEKLKIWEKRRLEIYHKSQVDKISYSKLAVQYGLTASRIGLIIKQVRKSLVN